jgi:hypothetical protein
VPAFLPVQGFSNFLAGILLCVMQHTQCTTGNYFMHSHIVLPATVPQFLCIGAIRKIIVALFVKQEDILTA